jgi:predicted  nucleic acid-binding Zn-ribbon protein
VFTGKTWNKGTITGWIMDNWIADVDDAQERSKVVQETFNTIKKQVQQYNDLNAELAKIKVERELSFVGPIEQLKAYRKQLTDSGYEVQNISDEIKKLKDKLVQGQKELNNVKDKDERKKIEERNKEISEALTAAQQKLIDKTKERFNIEDKIAAKQKEITDINKTFISSLDALKDKFNKVRESINYVYKDGKFINDTDAAKKESNYQRLITARYRLLELSGKKDLDSVKEQKTLQEKIFDLELERGKLVLDEMNKEREAAINNLKAMSNIVKESVKYRQTTQAGIEASSMEAIRLLSQRQDRQNLELSPMIEQQKQIKDIESRMLITQKQSFDSLGKIKLEIGKLIETIKNKSLSGSGGTNVQAVNPL